MQALEWMVAVELSKGKGGILALDMGVGKTNLYINLCKSLSTKILIVTTPACIDSVKRLVSNACDEDRGNFWKPRTLLISRVISLS